MTYQGWANKATHTFFVEMATPGSPDWASLARSCDGKPRARKEEILASAIMDHAYEAFADEAWDSLPTFAKALYLCSLSQVDWLEIARYWLDEISPPTQEEANIW